MIFTIAGDVVRDFDDEYEAWHWLELEGWGLAAIEPPDPVRPGACKYYFRRRVHEEHQMPETNEHRVLDTKTRSRSERSLRR